MAPLLYTPPTSTAITSAHLLHPDRQQQQAILLLGLKSGDVLYLDLAKSGASIKLASLGSAVVHLQSAPVADESSSLVSCISSDGCIRLLKVLWSTGQLLEQRLLLSAPSLDSNDGKPLQAILMPSSSLSCIVVYNRQLRLVSLENGATVQTVDLDSQLNACRLLADPEQLVALTSSGHLKLFSLSIGNDDPGGLALAASAQGHALNAYCCSSQFTKDNGRCLVTGGGDAVLCLWSISSDTNPLCPLWCQRAFNHIQDGSIRSVDVLVSRPDLGNDELLIVAATDGKVYGLRVLQDKVTTLNHLAHPNVGSIRDVLLLPQPSPSCMIVGERGVALVALQ